MIDKHLSICHYGAPNETPLESVYAEGIMTAVFIRPLLTIAIIFGLFGFVRFAVQKGFEPRKNKLIKYLGSLHLAVTLLVLLATLLSVATILESRHGTEYIMRTVYRASWFEFILIGIWTNIFFATVLRFPFRRNKIGFFLTHCGILTILLGSLMTRIEGQEGTITLAEGASSSVLNLQGNALELSDNNIQQKLASKNVEQLSLPRKLSKTEGSEILITEYHPHSSMSHMYLPNEDSISFPESNPAIQFTIRSSMFNLDRWLVHRNEDLRSPSEIKMGPAQISIRKVSREQAKNLISNVKNNNNKGTQTQAQLTISHDKGQTVKIYNATDVMNKEVEIGQNFKMVVTGVYRNAAVVQGKGIVDQPGPPNNPAIVFKLIYPDGSEKMSVRFQLHPDFQGMHDDGKAIKEPLIKALGVAPSAVQPAQCEFLVDDQGQYYYHITSSRVTQAGVLQLNKMIPMGWNDAVLVVKKLIPHASIKRVVMPKALGANAKSSLPMVRFEVNTDQGSEFKTLLYGESYNYSLDGKDKRIAFGPNSIDLPFTVRLKDFRKIDYPNTNRAMEYESDVIVEDLFVPANGGIKQRIETTISMNNVLDHAGWRFFQSSFRVEDGKEYSTFQVAKDPGIETIYLGSIVMVLGIGIMFWGLPGTREK